MFFLFFFGRPAGEKEAPLLPLTLLLFHFHYILFTMNPRLLMQSQCLALTLRRLSLSLSLSLSVAMLTTIGKRAACAARHRDESFTFSRLSSLSLSPGLLSL